MNSIKKEIKKLYLKIYFFIQANCINLFRTLFILKIKKNKINGKISLLCPTRQRTNKFLRFIKSIIEHTENLNNLELLVLIDEDEKFVSEYENLIEEINLKENFIKLYKKSLKSNPERMNFLYSKSNGEIILPVNDDMIFLTNHWDNYLRNDFNKCKLHEPFSVWLRCDRKYTYLDASAFPAVNRNWKNRLGYLSYPEFKNWYQDTWICDLGRRTGLYVVSKKILVKQFHANNFENEIDDTHRINHTKENIEFDDKIWLKTKEIRIKHSKKLKLNH